MCTTCTMRIYTICTTCMYHLYIRMHNTCTTCTSQVQHAHVCVNCTLCIYHFYRSAVQDGDADFVQHFPVNGSISMHVSLVKVSTKPRIHPTCTYSKIIRTYVHYRRLQFTSIGGGDWTAVCWVTTSTMYSTR